MITWKTSKASPNILYGGSGYFIVVRRRTCHEVCHGVDLRGRPVTFATAHSVKQAKALAERHAREATR